MWAPDNSRKACSRCGNEFTFFTRRHHCRSCGGLYCDNCSDYYVSVNNPVSQPGVFSQGLVSSSKNSGVQRVCFSCYHKEYAFVAVYTGFFSSLKSEVCASEDEARTFLEEREDGIIMHLGNAKIVFNKKPNDPVLTNRMWEKAKGKGRKIMGEMFYDAGSQTPNYVQGPSHKHLWPTANDPRKDGFEGGNPQFNNSRTNQNNNNNNNFFGGAGGATAAAMPLSNNNAAAASSSSSSATSSPVTANSSTQNGNNNTNDNNTPLPQFSLVVAMCLDGGARRLRFLQKDVHQDNSKLVVNIHKLAKEEFESEGKFAADKPPFVEAICLLDQDWTHPLSCETARFFYRAAPYIESTVDQIMNKERFVMCSHVGGRPKCEIITGGKEARRRLYENADNKISSVIVTAFGEPIGHTCRDVSWRRQLVETADTEGLKLLYNNQSRLVYVASTIPSANADVRVAGSLWDLEQATAGQIRTTVQAWVWDPDMVDKKCILTPFLGGSLAPPSVTPGQMDGVSSMMRKIGVANKSAAPMPTAASNFPVWNMPNQNQNQNQNNSSAAASSGNNSQRQQQNNNNTGGSAASSSLSAPPPRPKSDAGPTAAASSQAKQEASARPAPVSQKPECPICMDYYNSGVNKPLVLVCCGHSICAACWKGVLERKSANAATVSCPRCREEIEVTQRLVPNRTLLEQIE